MNHGLELKGMDSVPAVHHRGPSEIESTSHFEKDDEILARLGKKQVLKRNFGYWSMIGFSFTVLVTWESVLPLFTQGFLNGGPAGLVYGFLIAWIGCVSTYTVIAELASLAPTAGGQYYWVSLLAPETSRKFLSYITGWLTTIAWISNVAAAGYITAIMTQGLIALNQPDYVFRRFHGTLLTFAFILIAAFVNIRLISHLPTIERVMLILHVLGFFALLIPLVYLAPHRSASDVFTIFLNEGGWPNQSVSFCVGLLGSIATFVGADAAVHMSEEVQGAALTVPRAIFSTVVLSGALGFGTTLVLLFCLGDIESALNTRAIFPFIEVLAQGMSSIAGSTAIVSVVIVLSTSALIGFVATASRMTWSFARDRGLPFSMHLSKIYPRTSVPLNSIVVVCLIPCLLALINIGSSTVLSDVISLSVSGFYASYFVPCALLLWNRTTGSIGSNSSFGLARPAHDGEAVIPHLTWGPWRIPGILGIINNTYACLWLIFVVFWSFWPPATPVTPETMNYSVLVTGTVMVFSIGYYCIRGHKTYKGPLMEV